MGLDLGELMLFYKLYLSLLHFVDQRLKIMKSPFTRPEDFGKLPVAERLELRNALLADRGLIDVFIAENPFDMSGDELEEVRSWHNLVTDDFYVYRCLEQYTIFLTADEEPVLAYGVLSLGDPLKYLIGHRLPHRCKAVLLPFQGRIVYDGMLQGYDVHFGPGVRRRLDGEYQNAKKRYGIITSLPWTPGKAEPSGPKSSASIETASPSRGKAKEAKPSKPDAARQAHDRIVAVIDAFCREYLDDEYAAMCRKLAGLLARKRPSPLIRGKAESWASGIVRVIGWNNFLNDPSQPHHMLMTDIDERIGVSEATGSAKATAIRKLIKMRPYDPDWTLPSRLEENSLAWMIQVNGLLVDVRHAPREIQEEAFRKGLIPYIPDDQPRQSERE